MLDPTRSTPPLDVRLERLRRALPLDSDALLERFAVTYGGELGQERLWDDLARLRAGKNADGAWEVGLKPLRPAVRPAPRLAPARRRDPNVATRTDLSDGELCKTAVK